MDTTVVRPGKADSQVQFRVNLRTSDNGICVLFHIDHRYQEVFDDKGVHPDYLCLYVSGQSCVCTVIELKRSSADEAVRQIERFAARLKEEFRRRLPARLRLHVQGMIVSANAEAPHERLDRLHSSGLTIRFHVMHDTLDVREFVTKKLSSDDIYRRSQARGVGTGKARHGVPGPQPEAARRASFVERLLRTRATPRQASFRTSSGRQVYSGTEGIAVRYVAQADETIYLHAAPEEKTLRFLTRRNGGCAERLRSDIRNANVERKVVVEHLDG
jgi:hypothetical protein